MTRELLRGAQELVGVALDLLVVLSVVGRVEAACDRGGPARWLERLRRRGSSARPRSAAARERLRRAIRWVDARSAGGANCYRRALLEIALEPAAARTPLLLGLDPAGGRASGHAWLEGDEPPRPFAVVVRLEPGHR